MVEGPTHVWSAGEAAAFMSRGVDARAEAVLGLRQSAEVLQVGEVIAQDLDAWMLFEEGNDGRVGLESGIVHFHARCEVQRVAREG